MLTFALRIITHLTKMALFDKKQFFNVNPKNFQNEEF